MKKPKPPKTFQEVEDYIREKKLNVNPTVFWNCYNVADWYDKEGKPVLSWKQRLWTWHGRDKKTIAAETMKKLDSRTEEIRKQRIREQYQEYLGNKSTQALTDLKKDGGQLFKIAGWLIDEILAERKTT